MHRLIRRTELKAGYLQKIYQTTFKAEVGDSEAGNCMAACVASILEIPLDHVPNFAQYENWVDILTTWFFTQKYVVEVDDKPRQDLYSLVGGPSPRGSWGHAVVFYGDEMVHDPHPSGDGIVGELTDFDFWYFIPLSLEEFILGRQGLLYDG